MSDERPDMNLPPTSVALQGDPGPLQYAPVIDEAGLAGFVWISAATEATPRAGIVLLPWDTRTPSVPFQDDLGPVTLGLRQSTTDATQLLDDLRSVRGNQGQVGLLDTRTASSLAALRKMAGHPAP